MITVRTDRVSSRPELLELCQKNRLSTFRINLKLTNQYIKWLGPLAMFYAMWMCLVLTSKMDNGDNTTQLLSSTNFASRINFALNIISLLEDWNGSILDSQWLYFTKIIKTSQERYNDPRLFKYYIEFRLSFLYKSKFKVIF